MTNNSIPTATQWLLDTVGKTEQTVINSVYLIASQNVKGTGFLIKTGHIITNWHVIKDCSAKEIYALSSNTKKILFKNILSDENRDLAILTPKVQLSKGLEIIDRNIKVGMKVSTWGHPLGYSGPAPILSVGYLAGFRSHQENKTAKFVKRYIINAAFNPGNSGGPLCVFEDDKVIGIVVAKHAPIPSFLTGAIEVLSKNPSGVRYTYTDEQGKKIPFSESQVVAMVLNYLRNMTQVVIGEAIVGSELIAFLKENNIEI